LARSKTGQSDGVGQEFQKQLVTLSGSATRRPPRRAFSEESRPGPLPVL